jgi:glycosyltransferase involved in cell wall biosynthesis
VTEEEYLELLANATALLTASRQEGFGIPLVEAMRVGTPIAVSDIPVFHEIGGDAALYFPTDDPDAVADAVLTLADEGEWVRRSRAVVAQSRQFSWEASAKTLLQLMHSTFSPPGVPSGSAQESPLRRR